MAGRTLTDDECQEVLKAYETAGGNQTQAAGLMGLIRQTYMNRLTIARSRKDTLKPTIELPQFPDDDISIEEIIDSQTKRFEKRYAHHKSKKWYSIKVNLNGPIGVSFIGDPHLDDNHCNWSLLRHHCDLHKKTEGLFAVNIGDTTNNWIGKLLAQFGNQDSSQATARKLAKWFLADSGMTWIAWLIGNHDAWNDGGTILKGMGGHIVNMEEWQAQFRLVFPNGRECKIWAAHDFRGHSMWNSLHAPQKAAHTKAEADIYACGHTHNWAMHQEESASREFTYWLIRSRGYKFVDDYAEKLGHASQKEGASVTTIINPDATTSAGFVQSFADMDSAADYLKFLRKRARV